MFFQTIQDASATESGVRYIAMMIPQIVTLALTGAIVSKWGYYVGYPGFDTETNWLKRATRYPT
jgi:hypothetical protein